MVKYDFFRELQYCHAMHCYTIKMAIKTLNKIHYIIAMLCTPEVTLTYRIDFIQAQEKRAPFLEIDGNLKEKEKKKKHLLPFVNKA